MLKNKKILKANPRKKDKRSFQSAIVYVTSTNNNTKCTATTPEGNVIAWQTSGSVGYTGTKRSTPYPASEAATALMNKLRDLGVERIDIISQGLFGGRDTAIKTIGNYPNIKVGSIYDKTKIPCNGCRLKGRRRV